MTCVAEAGVGESHVVLVEATSSCLDGEPPRTLAMCDGCNCTADAGSCDSSVQSFLDSACTNSVATAVGPGCYDTTTLEDRWFTTTLTPDGNASCMADKPTEPSTPLYLCESEPQADCDGGVCVPSGPASCILKTTPGCSEPYVVEQTLFDDATNACDCSCSAGMQGCASTDIEIFPGANNCTGMSTMIAGGNCVAAGQADSLRVPPVAGTVSCTPSGVIAGAAALTLCCLP